MFLVSTIRYVESLLPAEQRSSHRYQSRNVYGKVLQTRDQLQ